MKKDRMETRSKTKIGDIPAIGTALSDEGLRLVAGGMPRVTHPPSMTEPGKPDTATDDDP